MRSPTEASFMKTIVIACLLLQSALAYALDWQDSPAVDALFRNAKVQGAFVLYDVRKNQLLGTNHERATTQLVPASTFKVAHSLIGLSVGAVKSMDEVLPYGGGPQPLKAWEKDMGLREAIAVSNVPVYQALARRIGLDRMQAVLLTMHYGNAEVGSVVDQFWLRGPLKISAIEQAVFLAQLAQGRLPFSQAHQQAVSDAIEFERQADWVLYGKTGWENYPNPGTGWWVGWVLKNGQVYAFALNIDARNPADAAKRIELGKACLSALGVI